MTRGEEPKKKPKLSIVSEENPPKRDVGPYQPADEVIYNGQLYSVLTCYKSGQKWYLHLKHKDTDTVIEGISADPKTVRPASLKAFDAR